jgi:hypothetical protein
MRVDLIKLGTFMDAIIRINWEKGRGEIDSITLNARSGMHDSLTGTVTRSIPVTQKARRTETRKFSVVYGNTLVFLGQRRKLAFEPTPA